MQTAVFDLTTRRKNLELAASAVADVVIVGGGITGAGVAREASLRGLATVLLDKGDFASGTSSRSSKLIHGGLRYLAQGDIALVREAARERAVLRRLAPHLAEPLWMMMPTASLAGRMKMQAGVWTFEKLAGDEAGERYQVLDRTQTLDKEPGLRPSPLAGAVVFQEYLTDDARLVLENIQSSSALGALVANYAEVTAVESDPEGLRLSVVDRLSGESLVIRARSLVNAAGPWFERVQSMASCSRASAEGGARLALTRGIHLVVPHSRLPVRHSVVLKSPDGRSTFVVPRGRVVYIGTTDTHYTGAPEEPGVSAADARYLLDSVAATFADAPAAHEIVGTWSGVRPLLAQEGKSPSEISRRDEIITGPGPVVAIAGGKLTTYRRMSERVCAEVFRVLGKSADASVDSSRIPLAGGGSADQETARASATPLKDSALEKRLWRTYGTAARNLAESIHANPELGAPVAGLEDLTHAEVEHAVRFEMATGLDDLLRRRSRIAMFDTAAAIAAAPGVARALGRVLGWDDEKIRNESDRMIAQWTGELAVVRSA
ncbi:MAG TPA: glycerol-3-phosphate dehydrogenase/oxidase [Candidatus Limnocylindrales bacterium]|nr:glycerol-3-phosphate dehydrogenase/oxidase [Candidatus Limnocylindrales bacterium]